MLYVSWPQEEFCHMIKKKKKAMALIQPFSCQIPLFTGGPGGGGTIPGERSLNLINTWCEGQGTNRFLSEITETEACVLSQLPVISGPDNGISKTLG